MPRTACRRLGEQSRCLMVGDRRSSIKFLESLEEFAGQLLPTRQWKAGIRHAWDDAVTSQPTYLTTLREALSSDLGFHGASGKHSTHGWHPFPAKFPPQLPEFLIKRLARANEVVLDPMFGSGTTIVEALRLGRRAIGCDIDPLARLILQAKLSPIDPLAAMRIGKSIVNAASRLFLEERGRLQKDLDGRFNTKTRAFVDYWFQQQQQLELVALLSCISSESPEEMRTFFNMVLSSTIIAKSGGLSLARDLAHTRPHRVLSKQPKSAFDEFDRRLRSTLSSCAAPTRGSAAEIRAASADATGLPCSSVDLIVTSPPYANNAIDYMRAHKFSLVWLGWKIEELSQIRARYLGHEAASPQEFNRLPRQCEGAIAKLKSLDAKKAAALRRYFGEMSSVIQEMRRVLKPGKAAVVVVGTSNLRGIDVETHKGLAAIGEQMGFEVAKIGVRRLDRDRRMMPARWNGARQSQIEQRMHEEYVIGFIKP